MNIYDEAKVITHEEARKILNTTEMGESPTRLLERKLKIHDYIVQQELKEERAKKVEELLGLINEKCDYLVHIMNGDKGLQENYIKLLSKIDNLEKELEVLE